MECGRCGRVLVSLGPVYLSIELFVRGAGTGQVKVLDEALDSGASLLEQHQLGERAERGERTLQMRLRRERKRDG